MRKLFVLILSIMALILCGCENYNSEKIIHEEFAGDYFTTINEWMPEDGYTYGIVYANDTGVKYFICSGGYRFGITPLYNADGSLQIYDGK